MTAQAQAQKPQHMPQNVIVDTDIGSDIDDAYAVLLAIFSPELNVKGITLVHADIETRAKITKKLLKLAGKADIPVIGGEKFPINKDRPLFWGGHEGRGIDFSDVETHASGEDAAEFIARTAAEKPGEHTLIPVGPLTNIALALQRYPQEMAQLKSIVCMGSIFNGFGRDAAGVEHNIAVDPEAAKIVLNSGIPILLVGLNVTTQVHLTRSQADEIGRIETPLADLMAHMTKDFFTLINKSSTVMHDPLAVAAFIVPDIVETIPVRAEVSTDTAGLITYFQAESPIRICTSVDVDRFDELFYPLITKAMRG